MAVYRNIHLSFWEDSKIYDDFTPEDKYFYLWVLTNPKTNMIGCYEISFKKAQSELGYTRDVIENLLNRLENNHSVINYDKKTKEVLILNWYKYNWTKSVKLDKPLQDGISKIKNNYFKNYLIDKYNERTEKEIPYAYPIDTTDAVTDTVTDSDILDIFNYWNSLNIVKHRTLTNEMIKLIEKKLKEYTKDEIMEYMNRYNIVKNDNDYFFDYTWTLTIFLKQKNCISEFTDEGSKWLDYLKKKNKKSNGNNGTGSVFDI